MIGLEGFDLLVDLGDQIRMTGFEFLDLFKVRLLCIELFVQGVLLQLCELTCSDFAFLKLKFIVSELFFCLRLKDSLGLSKLLIQGINIRVKLIQPGFLTLLAVFDERIGDL